MEQHKFLDSYTYVTEDGYIDSTQAVAVFNKSSDRVVRFFDYSRTKEFNTFFLEKDTKEIVVNHRTHKFLKPILFLNFYLWCDPSFKYESHEWLVDLLKQDFKTYNDLPKQYIKQTLIGVIAEQYINKQLFIEHLQKCFNDIKKVSRQTSIPVEDIYLSVLQMKSIIFNTENAVNTGIRVAVNNYHRKTNHE